MEKLTEHEIIEIIEKLQSAEGTDEEQSKWIWKIQNSVPFYQEIVNLLFWSNEDLSAVEIYIKAKEKYKPIILNAKKR